MVEVRNVPEDSRYEILVDGARVGVLEYRDKGDELVAVHTEIDPGHEGEGLGGIVVRALLDDVRRDGRLVVPVCPFVKGYLRRHPEYADLVKGR